MAGKDLQVATPSRDRGTARAALAVLLVAVAAVGVAQRGTDPGLLQAIDRAPVAVPTASPAPGVAVLARTAVPAPPPAAQATAISARHGTFIFATPDATSGDSTSLFAFYLEQMPGQGWTLLGKGDPTRAGGWTQRWQAGNDAALLTMTTRPRRELTVTLCPPNPYC